MRNPEKLYSCILLLLFLTTASSFSNTDSRHWTLANGKKIHAELVGYDPAKDEAVLRINEQEKKTYSLEDFSAIDAAWLLEWEKVSSDLDEMMLRTKGVFSHYQHEGTNLTADFYVYTPSKYKETKKLPLLILFHPAGKGARYVKRFVNTAEALDLIVVSSDAFRNTGGVWNKKDDAMLAYYKELLPALEATVPHDPAKLYMGGSSGGAQRAYHFSAMVDRPWAGIFANGGWIGGPKLYDLPFPKMKIVMVNGHRDPANRWIKYDRTVFEKRECEINVFAFEGGHQVPPPKIQFEALNWLLNGYPEEDSENPDSE